MAQKRPASYHHLKANCPYCSASWMGPDPYGWMKRHVSDMHSEHLEEFQKLPKKDYAEMVLTKRGQAKQKREEHLKKLKELEEKKKMEEMKAMEPETEPESPPAQEPPVVVEPPRPKEKPVQSRPAISVPVQEPIRRPKITLPVDIPLDEEQWLVQFLQKFDLTDKFVTFQVEKLRITGKLPHPKELLQELNGLDSGSKLKQQNDLIVWFYEHALNEFVQKRKSLNLPYEHLGVETTRDISRSLSPYERNYPYEKQYSPQEQPRPMYSDQSELRELKAKLEAMQQQKLDEMASRMRDMEMKYEQAKNQPHQDSYPQRLETKLESMESETKRLQQQLSEQAQMNLMNRIQQFEQRATQAPTMEAIQSFVQQAIEQDRTVKLRPEELEQKIRELVSKERTGITPEAVEMSKIEKTYELDKMKLQADSDKAGMWQDTIKSVAAVFGESLGRGLATGAQQPPGHPPASPHMPPSGPLEQPEPAAEAEEPQMKTCPNCQKSMLFALPPGITVGQCPYCRTPLEITPEGDLTPYEVPQPPPPQEKTPPAPKPTPPPPAEEPQEDTGSSLGKCTGCKRTLYYFNISRTDNDGKMWCKRCAEAQQNGLR